MNPRPRSELHIATQITYGVLGAVVPGLMAYGVGRLWCAGAVPAIPTQPCWEPVAAGACGAALGWVVVWTWLRWRAQEAAASRM